jgi:hypothetical protein
LLVEDGLMISHIGSLRASQALAGPAAGGQAPKPEGAREARGLDRPLPVWPHPPRAQRPAAQSFDVESFVGTAPIRGQNSWCRNGAASETHGTIKNNVQATT